MNWTDLAAALALVLVIEGLLPFASPRSWRQTLKVLSDMDERTIRGVGVASITAGLLLLYFVKH
ncbi:MAG: hypothetical protein DHS20C01_35520 [marine bacterium B5-7]|nr:MAG: hypothetical protein DHS20C01_35520 [marine bacterium B5-7]